MKAHTSAPLVESSDAIVPPAEFRCTTADTHAALWREFLATLRDSRDFWLIRMRWIAILSIVVTIGVAGLNGWVRDTGPLLLIALFMVGYNAYYTLRRNRSEQLKPDGTSELSMLPPLLLDIVSLTLLLHWSGGIRNPFAVFFVFHAAIGATFLRPRRACALGAAASLLWSTTVTLEHLGVLPQHPLLLNSTAATALEIQGMSAVGLVGYLIAFVTVLFGVIYFVRSVEHERLRAESKVLESERVILTRDRLARLGEISAGVAHTVRNPLQGVISCLDLLRTEHGANDDSSTELFEMMDEGLRRVEKVTRRLLVLTRERHLKVAPTNLDHLLAESVRFLQPKATEKGILLESILSDLPEILVDQEALTEAVTNIIDNAIQACSEGDQIQVEAKRIFGTAPSVMIQIQDSGPGIPEALLSRVFDPFFTTKSVGEGTGLGLAIAREVIEGHHGAISVSSTLSRGSCFELTLPLKVQS